MSDEEKVSQALAELWDVVRCRCHEAYTGRGLHDPDCECDSTDALQIVTDRIEALIAENERLGQQCEGLMQAAMNNGQALILAEAKLAKAVEALEEISEYDTGATAGLAYTAKHHLAGIKSGVATTPYGLEGENHE